MCWQQRTPTALQHESKPQGSQGAEPGVGIASTASLGSWCSAGAGLSLEAPPGPVAVLQMVICALGVEGVAVLLLPGWEVPDVKRESLSLSSPGSWQGNLTPEPLGFGREVTEQCSGVNAAHCAVKRCVSSLGCLHEGSLFFPSRYLNTPEISIGLPRTGICEGTELPPRTGSLPGLK